MGSTNGYSSVLIRGYRGLADLELNELRTFNVLLGANDVGKTSVLEAVFLLSNLADPRLSVRVQNWRNFLVEDIEDLSSIFHGIDSGNAIKIQAQSCDSPEHRELIITSPPIDRYIGEKNQRIGSLVNEGQSISVQPDKLAMGQSSSRVFGSRVLQYDATIRNKRRDSQTSFSASLIDHGGRWGVSHDLDKSDNTVIDAIVPARYMAPNSAYQTDDIGKLIINKKDERLIEYLRIINPRINKIAVQGNIAYLDIGLAEMMPLNMFGSGMKRAATILSACMLTDERILLIDELEYGLHYRAIGPLLMALLMLAETTQVQMFVTTHSNEFLKSLQHVLSQDSFVKYQSSTAYFALQRDKQGRVRSYRYEYEQFSHGMTHGIEIR